MMRGKLLVIEGPDGAGKTTLASSLAQILREEGKNVELIREPGGTALSEQIRLLLKGQTSPETEIDTRAETLLFCAARAQLCSQIIEPKLEEGTWIILDRFEYSTLVYQGLMRGLGTDQVEDVSRFARGTTEPDRILVLLVSAETARSRMQKRDGDEIDRMEEASADSLEEIIAEYRKLAEDNPKAVEISGEGNSGEVVGRAALALRDLL